VTRAHTEQGTFHLHELLASQGEGAEESEESEEPETRSEKLVQGKPGGSITSVVANQNFMSILEDEEDEAPPSHAPPQHKHEHKHGSKREELAKKDLHEAKHKEERRTKQRESGKSGAEKEVKSALENAKKQNQRTIDAWKKKKEESDAKMKKLKQEHEKERVVKVCVWFC